MRIHLKLLKILRTPVFCFITISNNLDEKKKVHDEIVKRIQADLDEFEILFKKAG